jgi:hypothetical protein
MITKAKFLAKIAQELATSRESSSRFVSTRKCPIINVRLLNDRNVLNLWNDWNQLIVVSERVRYKTEICIFL